MALQHEIWIQDIEDNLFNQSEFVRRSTDHSAFVQYKTVHVPAAGANPTITVDRSSYPATIGQRTDAELTYDLKSFDTEPILIPDIDELQTSYDKRSSVLGQHVEALSERIGLEAAFAWAATTGGAIVRTSGSASSDALAPSATGTRLAITRTDIRNLAKKFDKDNVPMEGRYLLMHTDMYYQLFAEDQNVSRDFMNMSSQEDGVIAKLYGFNIMQRPNVVLYDNSLTTPAKKAIGAVGAADDNLACIAWHQSFVSNALGTTKVFSDEDKPEYFGSVFSAMVMHAASPLRSSEVGIATLVQSA